MSFSVFLEVFSKSGAGEDLGEKKDGEACSKSSNSVKFNRLYVRITLSRWQGGQAWVRSWSSWASKPLAKGKIIQQLLRASW